jgi:ketosteroid isomerase-like protein
MTGDGWMPITRERASEVFKGLETGDGAVFIERVADVDWAAVGTHPLARHYPSKKASIEDTFARLCQILPRGAQLHVEHAIVKGDEAPVELHSSATARNGIHFDNRHCWVARFHGSNRECSRLPGLGDGRPAFRRESNSIRDRKDILGTPFKNPHFAKMAEAVGIRGIRLEKPAEVEPGVAAVLAHNGPVLVDVVVNREELSIRPRITPEMAKGFTLFMVKAVMNGRASEILDMAATNLWRG